MKASFSNGGLSFSQQERSCELAFADGGPYYHLCTPGWLTEILFVSQGDYKSCVNFIAVCAFKSNVRIISFEIMSNHLHFILEGAIEACLVFFKLLKSKLKRYFVSCGRYVKMDEFEPKPIRITDLAMMRNEIPYVSRNAHVATNCYTPFSYPWGCGCLYFNELTIRRDYIPWTDLSKNEKEKLCRCRVNDLPDYYCVADGMILPQSFCAFKRGMSFFRNARHYFTQISKNFESFSEVARRLGDDVFLNDDEMFAIVVNKSKEMFGEAKPTLLPPDAKIRVATILKKEYNASEGQIQRMLRLDRNVVADLFGHINWS